MTKKSFTEKSSSHASKHLANADEKNIKTKERSDSDSEPDSEDRDNNNNNNILTRFIPRDFRSPSTSSSSRSESLFRLVRCDCLVLKSCAACKQICILLTTLVIIIILCSHQCIKNKRNSQYQDDTEIEATPAAEKQKNTKSILKCGAQYYFLTIAVIAFLVESFTLLCYILHIVETFPKIPWLVIECVFYPIWGIQYFIASILVSTRGGGWFIFAAVLGFFDSFLFLMLSIIKYRKLKKGLPAQPASDDPDGNRKRAESPNLKFIAQPKQKKHKKNNQTDRHLDTESDSVNSV